MQHILPAEENSMGCVRKRGYTNMEFRIALAGKDNGLSRAFLGSMLALGVYFHSTQAS